MPWREVTCSSIWFVDRKRQQQLRLTMLSVEHPWPSDEWVSFGGSVEGVVDVANDVNCCLHYCFHLGSSWIESGILAVLLISLVYIIVLSYNSRRVRSTFLFWMWHKSMSNEVLMHKFFVVSAKIQRV